MISLKDQIGKFEKMVYNKDLAQFVTVDQMFVGGGITIESLIRENNFIVEELKKMGAVFINFCKLNGKVYSKIMEHELNFHNQQSKLHLLVNSVDRKVKYSINTMRQLQETMIMKNKKNTQTLERALVPLQFSLDQLTKEVDKKVDKTTFQVQMKKFLEQYDEGELFNQQVEAIIEEDRDYNGNIIEIQSTNNNNINNNNNNFSENAIVIEKKSIIKKKGKVGYEEFYTLKAQIQQIFNRFDASEKNIEKISQQATLGKDLINNLIPIVNLQSSSIKMHQQKIFNFKRQIQQLQNILDHSEKQLSIQLHNRTNDVIWSNKFEQFQQRQLNHIFNRLQVGLKACQQDIKQNKSQSNRKFNTVCKQISQIKEEAQHYSTVTNENTKQIQKRHIQIKKNHNEFKMQNKAINQNIDLFSRQSQKTISQLERALRNQIESSNKFIQNLSDSIEQSVMKTVNKIVLSQLKMIQSYNRQNLVRISDLKANVKSIAQQNSNVKDILSKKMNFTDFIHQVERKADKQDFQQLKSKVHETSQHLYDQEINQNINLKKTYRSKSCRKESSLTKTSKTLFTPITSNSKIENSDYDSEKKLLMCRLQTQKEQNSKKFNQNIRRCSLKSSNGF